MSPLPEGYINKNVDAYISPELSAHDRLVMEGVMSLLRPEQWPNVIFYDAAGDGRIYANRPELQRLAFQYQPIPGQPGVYRGPTGETFILPPNPPPAERGLPVAPQPQSTMPQRDSTGPFYRLFILDGTSWTGNAVTPDYWPGPTPSPTAGYPSVYDYCNAYVRGTSTGELVIYTGAFANLQKSSPTQVEFGVAFVHNDPTTGFVPYMSVVPKPAATPTVTGYRGKFGCFWNNGSPNLIFSVLSPTMIEGIFSGDVDRRPCIPTCPAPDPQTTTWVQSVSSTDGFNTSGTNMATYLNVAAAQNSSSKGYIMDNSFFSMYITNNGSAGYGGTAGTGTWTAATSACNLENPVGYDTGQLGNCLGWGNAVYQGAHPFPTPSPNAIFVYAAGASGPELVSICLANPRCVGIPVWQHP